jgi:hypothetical protein
VDNFCLSLVLSVVTVSCICNYRYKLHLHESNSYSNIFSVTSYTISVVLSVSVSTQSRSAPLRLFFFSWVWYSVAVRAVFQACLSTFVIEPACVKPIKTVEQILNYEKEFGFVDWNVNFFISSSESLNSAILKNAVICLDEDTCVISKITGLNY